MMNRKEFLRTSTIIGGATILPTNNVFSQNVTENGIDKLVDSEGNFIQNPLPYTKTFLEPHMDEESLGTVEEGKYADMILLDRNPLDSIKNTLLINRVIKNG